MFEKLTVNLEHCYGIGSLEYVFDFARGLAFGIYAPNGVMKTSFARTFQDLASGQETVDRIFEERVSVRSIKGSDGQEISPEAVFVVEPYNEAFRSENASKLLANSGLKSRYDSIHRNLDTRLAKLLDELTKLSGLKKDIRQVFVADILGASKDIYVALGRLEREVKNSSSSDFSSLQHNELFNQKVVALIEDGGISEKFQVYTENYDALVSKSRFFKKGIFNHTNAAALAKQLKDNGWFKGGHSVTLKSSGTLVEISNEQELTDFVQGEMETILNDPALKKSFDEIDKALVKNAELKSFREFLLNNQTIIPEFEDIPAFKQKLWISYLYEKNEQYFELLREYDRAREELENIAGEAKSETTRWIEVLNIFNQRFSVPFTVLMDNQEDVILRSETPVVAFDFHDDMAEPAKPVEEKTLLKSLSQGERRALYLLNVIFEVEARRSEQRETLFVVDDIADSFDYKNKYAIIEYLKEMEETGYFYLLIFYA